MVSEKKYSMQIPHFVNLTKSVTVAVNPSRPKPGRREALKAFIKPFEAPQRSVKIKT